MRTRYCVLLLASLLCGPAMAAAPAPVQRVLFIGNSLTYTNNVPNLVKAFAREGGVTLQVTMRAEPAWSLRDHLRSARSRDLLGRRWDVVVLQQGASAAPENAALLRDWAEQIARIAAAAGTPRVALYAPMPAQAHLDDLDATRASWSAAATAAHACVLPVTRAAQRAFAADPQIVLHDPDRIHSNMAGSLLAAAVITQGLFGAQASAPSRLPTRDAIDPRIRRWLDATAAQALADTPDACRPVSPQ